MGGGWMYVELKIELSSMLLERPMSSSGWKQADDVIVALSTTFSRY